MTSALDLDQEVPLSDEALTALALAADPNPTIDAAAIPWSPVSGTETALLPDWYMPAPRSPSTGHRRWPAAVATVIIVGFLVIDAFGLCITSGFLSWA